MRNQDGIDPISLDKYLTTPPDDGEEPDPSPLAVDDIIWWRHSLRGGYGYVEHITGVVLALSPTRVKIAVQRRLGDTVERWVKRENVERKEYR